MLGYGKSIGWILLALVWPAYTMGFGLCTQRIARGFVTTSFHETAFQMVDPLVEGEVAKVVLIKKTEFADGENSQTFRAFIEKFPAVANRTGFTIWRPNERDTYLIYPSPRGINYRLARQRISHLSFVEDDSAELTPAVRWLRQFSASGEIAMMVNLPYADDGGLERNFHFHDMFIHAIGWLLVPREFIGMSRQRAEYLLTVYDDPVLHASATVRRYVERLIDDEVERCDTATYHLLGAIAARRGIDRSNARIAMKKFATSYHYYQSALETSVTLSAAERARLEKIKDRWKSRPILNEEQIGDIVRNSDWTLNKWPH